jgi:hypothetical protein
MQRRHFLAGTAALSAVSSASTAQTETAPPAIIELRFFQCRNTTDNQRGRLQDWLSHSALPALKRAGTGTIGLFSSSIAPEAPFFMVLVSHASMVAFEQTQEKLGQDEAFVNVSEAFFNGVGLPFQRMETRLLRAFSGFPQVEIPPQAEGRPARIFELRTYESNTPVTLARKIRMFEEGEIDIFRKAGLLPVFFAETIVGPQQPNLTYMVGFDNLAAREANWRAFGASPEWQKLRATPGLSDGEIVSNVSNMILTPLAGSQIR